MTCEHTGDYSQFIALLGSLADHRRHNGSLDAGRRGKSGPAIEQILRELAALDYERMLSLAIADGNVPSKQSTHLRRMLREVAESTALGQAIDKRKRVGAKETKLAAVPSVDLATPPPRRVSKPLMRSHPVSYEATDVPVPMEGLPSAEILAARRRDAKIGQPMAHPDPKTPLGQLITRENVVSDTLTFSRVMLAYLKYGLSDTGAKFLRTDIAVYSALVKELRANGLA